MPGLFFDNGFGMKGDTQTGNRQHRQIIGTVTYSYHLFSTDTFLLRQLLQQAGLHPTIDDLALDLAGQLAVLKIELIGMDIINPEFLLEIVGEIGKATGEDRHLVAEVFECTDQPLRPFGDRQLLGNPLQHRLIQTFQQRHAPPKALGEIDFAAHGRLGNFRHLIADAGHLRQFIDHLGLDQRGIHVETDQATAAAVEIVLLHGHIDIHLLGYLQELGMHGRDILHFAAQRQLHGSPTGNGLCAVQ